MDWDAEIETIQQRWTENQGEIEQTERQRDEIVTRYDDRLSALYTEGVTLNGEARFARRMKAEQESRHQEAQQASDSASPVAPSDEASAAGDGEASNPVATTDRPSPEPSDTPAEAQGTEAASA